MAACRFSSLYADLNLLLRHARVLHARRPTLQKLPKRKRHPLHVLHLRGSACAPMSTANLKNVSQMLVDFSVKCVSTSPVRLTSIIACFRNDIPPCALAPRCKSGAFRLSVNSPLPFAKNIVQMLVNSSLRLNFAMPGISFPTQRHGGPGGAYLALFFPAVRLCASAFFILWAKR